MRWLFCLRFRPAISSLLNSSLTTRKLDRRSDSCSSPHKYLQKPTQTWELKNMIIGTRKTEPSTGENGASEARTDQGVYTQGDSTQATTVNMFRFWCQSCANVEQVLGNFSPAIDGLAQNQSPRNWGLRMDNLRVFNWSVQCTAGKQNHTINIQSFSERNSYSVPISCILERSLNACKSDIRTNWPCRGTKQIRSWIFWARM